MCDPDPSSDPAALCAELTAAETGVWQALVDGDANADAAALDAAFLGVYPSGFAGRADHVGQLDTGPTVAQFQLSDLRVKPLGLDFAVLSYSARFQRVASTVSEKMYVSSIWQRSGDGWVNVFSQDTPADDP